MADQGTNVDVPTWQAIGGAYRCPFAGWEVWNIDILEVCVATRSLRERLITSIQDLYQRKGSNVAFCNSGFHKLARLVLIDLPTGRQLPGSKRFAVNSTHKSRNSSHRTRVQNSQ